MTQRMSQRKQGRIKKPSIFSFITLVFLLVVVSCRAETTEHGAETASPQQTPPVPGVAATQKSADSEPAANGLTARLEIPPSLTLDGPVKIQFLLANETDSDLYILNWLTPFEKLGGDIFRVTRDGQRIPYQGPLASRGDPTPEAYTVIKAGAIAQAEVDLSLAYDFSIPGDYTIEFVSPKLSHIAHPKEEMARSVAELGPVEIPSNQVAVTIGN